MIWQPFAFHIPPFPANPSKTAFYSLVRKSLILKLTSPFFFMKIRTTLQLFLEMAPLSPKNFFLAVGGMKHHFQPQGLSCTRRKAMEVTLMACECRCSWPLEVVKIGYEGHQNRLSVPIMFKTSMLLVRKK